MFAVRRIVTPTDLKKVMRSEDYVVFEFVNPSPAVEPEIRHTIDEIFGELQYMLGDDDLERCYLDDVSEPLQNLTQLGLQLVGVLTSGTMRMMAASSEPLSWRRTYYIVAPDPAFYYLPDTAPAVVHLLGVDCGGVRAITRSHGKHIAVYGSHQAITEAFEREMPWCEKCGVAVVEASLG
jgi:hypothetical protein